jgi:hypothetical protein
MRATWAYAALIVHAPIWASDPPGDNIAQKIAYIRNQEVSLKPECPVIPRMLSAD